MKNTQQDKDNKNVTTLMSIITPDDKKLRDVFKNQKVYYIDIYQREYRWTNINVETLLNDIQLRFDQYERTKENPREIQAHVLEEFEPYFLNTYLTHSTSTDISIVDGQQRLTTFLLILIKLYKIIRCIEEEKPSDKNTFSSTALRNLIYESDDFGEAKRFKIYNENREEIFKKIIDTDVESIRNVDETQQRIKENYEVISNYFNDYFDYNESDASCNIKKLTYYISYILDRISIVEIKIEKQKNVAMIFEVVNDRGLGLKPYEILKGKLLGNLPQNEKEQSNNIWTELQNKYFKAKIKNSKERTIDLDDFFQTYFRAKFADGESDYEKFEGDYHYEIYRNDRIKEYFGNFNNNEILLRKITQDIKYFADLYHWLRTTYENEFLIYNKLLEQNQQYLLILSGIEYNDPNKDEKITCIAKKFDQFHTILRLFDIYESNMFQRLIYQLNKKIRNKSVSEIKDIFDKELISALENQDFIQKNEINNTSELFTYERFKNVKNRWINFSKYVLMRFDRYLSEKMDKPSFVKENLSELEERFNKFSRKIYGLHLEHIYAFNDSNIEQFKNEEGIFDEQLFNEVRNKLGVLLLLKDKQNLSSNNEKYLDKIETYKTSNFIWNELLVGHIHRVDEKIIPENIDIEVITPNENGAFPKDKVESRQKSVFNMIKKIWLDSV